MSERRTRPAFLVAAVAVGTVTGAILIAVSGGAPVGAPDATNTSAALGGDAHARISLPPRRRWFGFSGAFFAWTGSHPRLDHGLTPERTVTDALAAGANSARVFVGWWDLEPQPGRLNREYVDKIDRFVNALERRDGRVLFVLGTTPPWASTRPGDSGAPPRDDRRVTAAFARFAAFVARRWPRALAIETWNEPNGIYSWRPRPDPEHYTRLHRVAAAAIRDAVPRMRVLVGGLAATVGDERFMPPRRYLERMYAAGLRPRDYDGLAVHPYPAHGTVGDLERGPFADGLRDFRRGYARRDRDVDIWVTETGATTSGPNPLSGREQREQVLLLTRKLLTMPDVVGVYLHTQYDYRAAPSSSPDRGWGLMSARGGNPGRPKPAFCALRALMRDPPRFAGCRGRRR